MAEDTEVLLGEKETGAVSTSGWRGALFGLGTALAFSISPIFIRHGLEDLPSPLLGVTVGMIASTLAYGLILLFRSGASQGEAIPRRAMLLQLAAGALVGLSTWARWVALDLAPVGVVLALGRMSVPVVILLSPILVGKHLERVTARVWLGAALIVAGSLVLAFFG